MKIDNTPQITAQSIPFAKQQEASLATSNHAPTTVGASSSLADIEKSNLKAPPLTTEMVNQVNQTFEAHGSQLMFQLDADAGKMILYLKDAKTGEVIRQLPDKETLRISKQIGDYLDAVKSNQNPKGMMSLFSGAFTDIKA